MAANRFRELAGELAARDAGLDAALGEVRTAASGLRARAAEAVETFRCAAIAHGAGHLAGIEVGPLEPDDKHVDCLQFRVARGRWQALCVAKARAEGPKVTLVGPFKRGKPEKPCRDFALRGPDVERGLDDLLERLIREASER